jgi:DNA polymerase IIIc chi subunit
MTAVETKGEIHKIVDKMESEKDLELYFNLLKYLNSGSSNLIESLTEEQQKKLDKSIIESYDKENLIPHKVVLQKFDKWLTK